jgi:predicted ArsR family transcriptional regulator
VEILGSSRVAKAASPRDETEPTRLQSESGTDAPTRERVASAILELGPSTAATLADRLELTPAAIRRHLDHMLEDGTVQAREPRVYGARGRGRPAKVFALTEAGRERFDQQYDDLAVEALRFLAETAGEDAVMAFARRRVADLETVHAQVMAADPRLTPSEAMAEAMTRAGYAASVRESPIGEQLCQQHCPVSHVAHEFPQLCEAETELISKVLGSHVQRLATIAHGDGVCTTCIPAPQNARPTSATERNAR